MLLRFRQLEHCARFRRQAFLTVGLMAVLMVLLSSGLQHRDQIAPEAGSLLYRGLTWGMLLLLIRIPWDGHPDTALSQSGLQRMLGGWMVDGVGALILMALCLPLYALAFFVGGVSVGVLFRAGLILIAAVLLTRAIQHVVPAEDEIALGVAQATLITLSMLPYLLGLLPGTPRLLIAAGEVLSPWHMLSSCFLGDPPLALFLASYAAGILSLDGWAMRYPSTKGLGW